MQIWNTIFLLCKGIKNTEFYAELKSIEKLQKSSPKKLLSKVEGITEFLDFYHYLSKFLVQNFFC
jgi:hypothetical protein